VGIAKTVNLPDTAAIKFGNSGDLQIFHSESQSTIQHVGLGTLQLKGENVKLIHSGNERLRTTGYGVTVTGIVSAFSYRGDGSQLQGINSSQLIDSGGTVRAEATASPAGLDITGTVTVTNTIIGKQGFLLDGTASDAGDIHSRGGHDGIAVLQNSSALGEWRIATRKADGVTDQTIATFKLTDDITQQPVLECAGDIIAFSGSDIDLKENIKPIENALDMITSLSGNTFSWKSGGNIFGDNGLDTGIIAQEVEALGLPGITKRRGDGTMGVRYDRLIPVLIEAVKELTAKVNSLENK